MNKFIEEYHSYYYQKYKWRKYVGMDLNIFTTRSAPELGVNKKKFATREVGDLSRF